MKKLLFLVLFVSCLSAKSVLAQSATGTSQAENPQASTESLVALPDLGVIDISPLVYSNGKHYFKAKIKNFSTTLAALNVQVKYKVGNLGWVTLPPVLGHLSQGQILMTGTLPSNGIASLARGKYYIVQVCTLNDPNNGNNCKVKTLLAQ